MEQEALHTVLNEILSDREQFAKSLKFVGDQLKELNQKLSGLDQRLAVLETAAAQKPPAPSFEQPLSEIRSLYRKISDEADKLNALAITRDSLQSAYLKTEFTRINKHLIDEPRTLVRKFGLLVLPENDHQGNLRFYYSRGLLWTLGCLALIGAVMLIRQAVSEHYYREHYVTLPSGEVPSTPTLPNTPPPAPVHRPSPHHHSVKTPPVQSLERDSTGQGGTDSFP